ncbi:aminoglycoside phosphotransferase family protein [Streptomyces caniscabiei]|uniref:Aminoglycoside phosphotransferase family protein n=1 Tax=Streptomyces caniscabiei TaxID=2746961 RepID=A0A927LCD4_9ACTN|nr:aminoglycoside phosphotransferase family protein [Streptomyces caniscabiei]MBD9728601.1 aminoglycoside phosphotransferase family protein [Streptomyces caniscabiei]MDX3509633.1 aminoglycoside phosphotransferase family protein [Streptomyces caniscabiei]MDX3723045.1 aminoglycoside phosphotransferase family protein [Streptomyces caniscabiei]WEO28275.1 aminoglycoside phosphotransferase family protein [Streptomyces caniscabiei]
MTTDTADPAVLPALQAKLRGTAHPGPTPCAHPDTVLAERADGTVVRHADTVAKAHAPGTDPTRLALRLTVAASHPEILLAPLDTTPTPLHGRLVTFWPYGTPVDPDTPEAAPWEEAATLLARLHRQTPTPGLPPMRGPAKAARAVARLEAAAPDHPATASVLRAWRTLPAWARSEAPMPDTTTVCHGDLHLGQLVRRPATTGPWRLIDVDDLGVGVPAWDLARPAAWYACGLLHPDEWIRFLTAYRTAGGPAVPVDGDPWPQLDVVARALTVQTAALAIAKSTTAGHPLDEAQQSVVDACDRMGSIPPELVGPFPK